MSRSRPRRRKRLHASPPHMRNGLLYGAVLVVLSCVTTVSIASQRILSEQSAYGAAPSADQCVPKNLGVSDVLPGTDVAVSPLPGAYDASPRTQVSLLGAPASALSGISVSGSHSGPDSGRLVAYSQGDGASFLPSHPFTPGETVTVTGHAGGREAPLLLQLCGGAPRHAPLPRHAHDAPRKPAMTRSTTPRRRRRRHRGSR